MKRFIVISTAITSLATLATGGEPKQNFVSAVQMVVQESSPGLVARSQKIVIRQFGNSINSLTSLQGVPYDVRTQGEEIVFSMTTNQDMRESVQQAVAMMVEGLNGVARVRGRTFSYEADLSEPDVGFLEVVSEPNRPKMANFNRIHKVTANLVPLRDLVNVIRKRLRSAAFSYTLPFECGDQLVSWKYQAKEGSDGLDADGVLIAMKQDLGLEHEKRNGIYYFKNDCSQWAPPRPAQLNKGPGEVASADMLPVGFIQPSGSPAQVFLSLPPIQ